MTSTDLSVPRPVEEIDVLDPRMREFETPPSDPIELLREWYAEAEESGVVEAGAMALATVDRDGVPSNRTVKILELTSRGLVFTSHAISRKGRDIADTGLAAGVHHWPALDRQLIVGGHVVVMPSVDSDRFWRGRPAATNAMSVATVQSAPLGDQRDLLERARDLAACAELLDRPETWVAYEIVPTSLEFWHVGVERLHRRLRFDAGPGGWRSSLLQP